MGGPVCRVGVSSLVPPKARGPTIQALGMGPDGVILLTVLRASGGTDEGKGIEEMKRLTRRGFLKAAGVGATALTALPTVHVRKAPAAWARASRIHPNVQDLRVVGLTDPRMTKGIERNCGWPRQEELVVREVVWEDMDKLACALAETRATPEAWRAIFVKPPGKSWSDVVVAIKSNQIALHKQHTHSAVMAKICHVLVHLLGVKAWNIHIYDGVHGETMERDTPFAGLPEGCRVQGTWGGVTAPTQIPEPWEGGRRKSACLKYLVDGTVDILINMSLCKGHSPRFGGFTMSMKNHFGTFSPRPGHREGSEDYLIAISLTPEILGPMDAKSGKVLYPRQQLCVMDALWASKGGPVTMPSDQPNFLAMGVFAPAFDYVLATRFRGERMGWEPEMQMTRRILTEFGYDESDLPNGGKIVEP